MDIGGKSRLLMGILVVVALLVYVVVVDLGMSAGRIHRGVDIEGVAPEVGGLTVNEALEVVALRGEELENAPVLFITRGFDCRFAPYELGWRSRPYATVQRAMAIGREGGIITALADRLRSWTSGVTVGWADGPNNKRMTRFLKDCEELGRAFGVEVDRGRLRREAKTAIETWPRKFFELPLVES